jgi:uncharacterized protein (TIGR02145 family)
MNDDSISRKLSELFDLYKSGALTEEEYESLKSKIINQPEGDQQLEGKKNDISEPSKAEEPEEKLPEADSPEVDGKEKTSRKPVIIALLSLIILGLVALAVILIKPSDDRTGPGKKNRSKEIKVMDIDGNSYNTVTIGTQTWMTENLKTTKYNDGSAIELVTDSISWAKLTTPAYCWYNNDENTSKNSFGALYNWYAVETNKLCPVGWHVPTSEEWTVLEEYLINNGFGYEGSGDDIAKSIAAASGWFTSDTAGNVGNDQATNNRSGFTASQGGYRFSRGSYLYMGRYGKWWSSSESSKTSAFIRFIYSGSDRVISYSNQKRNGFSVRCIKDTGEPGSVSTVNSVQASDSKSGVWDSTSAVKSITDDLNRYTQWPFNESFSTEELKHEFYDFVDIALEGKELKVGVVYTILDGHCPPYCNPMLSAFEFENKGGWYLSRKAIAFQALSPEGRIEFYKISPREYGILVKNRFSSGKWGTSNSINLYAFVNDKLMQTLGWYREDLDTVYSARVLKTIQDGQSYVMLEEKAKPYDGDTILSKSYYRFNGTEYEEFSGYITDPSLTSINRFYDINSVSERENNICPTCHGTGVQVCNLCGGTGRNNMGIECGCIRTYNAEIAAGNIPSHPPLKWTCPSCGGTGKYNL